MYQGLTRRFVELLQLKQSPVGMAFVDTLPGGVVHVNRRVPSACTFWRLAERGVFYANAEDHQECPIGMMTMGFTMPEASQHIIELFLDNLQPDRPRFRQSVETQRAEQLLITGKGKSHDNNQTTR